MHTGDHITATSNIINTLVKANVATSKSNSNTQEHGQLFRVKKVATSTPDKNTVHSYLYT